ncbi:hypothetical protein T01_16053 [Trichinella spiralis]|uniref:Uncharacterized protein n=1 Tax=Trichinella spiralis TaxID=6334 RepID=A0A0V0Z4Y8_TRISP|nr:hypothetical protein T01_16053 [Trichinella spiralis]
MLVIADRFIMQIGWIFVLCFTFPRYSVATSKCHDLNGVAPADWQRDHFQKLTEMYFIDE